ncbi:uncharacterized protein LOC132747729 [Ruditapes philippinarum]|uniref:uncharacterized protein LOC132747729 n=1 Tax=Ruditapes philippinarum TaxID=129788 RepID=UPI00295B268A|nr:uncharacterized protein LOC132747729 [Ruditapes philippinarum]
MALLNQIFMTSVISLLAFDASTTHLSMVFLCDSNLHDICEDAINNIKELPIEVEDVHIELVGIVIRSSGDFIQDVRSLNNADSENIILFIGIGNDHVVNAVSCISRAVGVPAFVYSTLSHRINMFEQDVISIHPDREGLAQAIITIIGKQLVRNAFVICQDTLQFDGFMEVFHRNNMQYNRSNESLESTISVSDSDLDLRTLLLNVHDNGFRLLIVHSSPQLFERLIKIATNMLYFNTGYAWIITEEAMPNVPMSTNVTMTTGDEMPKGLLAVDGYEEDNYMTLLNDVVKIARSEILLLLKKAYKYNLTSRYMAENFRVVLAGRQDVYQSFFRGLQSNNLLFGDDGRRKNMQYRLLNYIEENKGNKSFWWTVGYIRGNDLDLNTLSFGQDSQSLYQYITFEHSILLLPRPAAPFLYIIRGPTEIT